MSNTLNTQIVESSKPLLPCGSVWYERLIEDQLPLARQTAALFNHLQAAAYFDELGNWISAVPGGPIFYPWSFKPSDVQIQGPATWGYDDQLAVPLYGTFVPTDVSKARAYLTADGRVIETAEGDVNALPASIALSEQTVWFLPRPTDFHPVRLISVSATLVEGAGFIVAGNWVMLYRSPQELWPDGVVVSLSVRIARSWKSTTLRVDNLRTSGREIALYRRNSQNLKQFERALCEVAGLPILDREGVVARLETGGNQVIHWLDDGRSFTLPVSSPYDVGSTVPAGSGHILTLRHQELQGSEWWRNRPWQAAGIPVFVIRPNFYGFAFKDESTYAYSIEEGSSSDAPILRARMVLNQNAETEDLFWTWQAAMERMQGVETLARDILGFTDAGQSTPVNPLGIYAQVLGPWLAVVETSLDEVNLAAFKAVEDFIERERPAGMQVYLAGTSAAFTVPEFHAVYLDTGELADIEPDVMAVIPLGY